ncbi:MAG: hypothetical protein C0518_08935 [Opitutus sp.]|nr:hypothetical protein [Opitutus sp.]
MSWRLAAVVLSGWLAADMSATEERDLFVFVESGVWDISDDGLPFRAGVILPSHHDPLSRFLRMREPRWVLAVGYALIPDVYDEGTGQLSAAGGNGFLVGAAREWAWELPRVLGERASLALAIDFGLHYATRTLPPNGTHANFLVSPGLSWESAPDPGRARWHVGLRWFHLSNADVFGRNAGYDGISLRFGRSW